jgi:hypothetical protein
MKETDTSAKSWDLLALSPQDRKEAMRNLASFVKTLHLLEIEVSTCWFLHPRQASMLAALEQWSGEATESPNSTGKGTFEWWTAGVAPYVALGFSSHSHHKERGAKAHELSRRTPTPTFAEFIDSPAFDEVWLAPTDDDSTAVTEGDELAV